MVKGKREVAELGSHWLRVAHLDAQQTLDCAYTRCGKSEPIALVLYRRKGHPGPSYKVQRTIQNAANGRLHGSMPLRLQLPVLPQSESAHEDGRDVAKRKIQELLQGSRQRIDPRSVRV